MNTEVEVCRELEELNQWICWRYGERISTTTGKREKVPVIPYSGYKASTTNPKHWGTLLQALARARGGKVEGVGFVLTKRDGYVVIDLDNCIVDGKLTPLAAEIVSRLTTYIEISPSGKGLHIWVKSDRLVNFKSSEIEIYSYGRYMTMTFNRWPFTPDTIAVDKQDIIGELLERFDSKQDQPEQQANHRQYNNALPDDDQKLWELIIENDKKERIGRLRDGDISVAISKKRKKKGPDPSLAVLMLLNTLAKYTKGDQVRMRRMIEQTRLPNDKWTAKRGDGDWLDMQIANACAYMRV